MSLRNLFGKASARALCSVDDELEGEGGGGAPAAPASVRESLGAAWDEFEAAGESQGAAKAADDPASSRTPKEPAQPAQSAAATDGRVRDENGRFVAKPGDAAQNDSTKPLSAEAVVGEPGAGQTIAPPASWSATAKAKFSALDPVIQAEVLKRESDMERGRAQWQAGAERLNRLDRVLAPRSQQLQLRGLDEVQAINALFAAQDYLERDPVEALLYLGRTVGVNWQALGARLQGQAPAQGGQPGPARVPQQLAPLFQQVQTLTQWAQQQQQQAQQDRISGHLSQVQQFAADPKNVYFENVREQMGRLIKAGAATSLEDAYSQACWANPEIRPLMLQAQAGEREAQRKAADLAKVQQARHASGSLTGSPAPGASSGSRGPSPKTVRGGLEQAWDALAS